MAMARGYDFEQPNELGGRSSQGSPNVTGVPMPTTPIASPFSRPSSRPRPGAFAPGAPAPGSFPNAGGGPEPGHPSVPQPPAPPTPGAPTKPGTVPPRTERVSSLAEGEGRKLADQNHINTSPKYQFLSMMPYYGRGEEQQLLSDLQSKYSDYWSGWQWDGKGNFRYGGDPAKLNEAWRMPNGQMPSFVDAYEGYNGGGQLRGRWGMEDGTGTSDPMVNALLQAFSVPGMQAPAPSMDMNSILALVSAMQPQQAAPQPINLQLPAEDYYAPAPSFSGSVAPSPLNFGGDGLPQALQLMAQRAPYIYYPQQAEGDDLLAQIRRLVSGV